MADSDAVTDEPVDDSIPADSPQVGWPDLKALYAQLDAAAVDAIEAKAPKSAPRDKAAIERDILDADLDGKKQFYKLRTHWSWVTTICLGILILAQITLICLIGGRWYDFTKHIVTVNLFMGQTFLQVVGIAYIVVRYLFPSAEEKKPAESPATKPEASTAPTPTPTATTAPEATPATKPAETTA